MGWVLGSSSRSPVTSSWHGFPMDLQKRIGVLVPRSMVSSFPGPLPKSKLGEPDLLSRPFLGWPFGDISFSFLHGKTLMPLPPRGGQIQWGRLLPVGGDLGKGPHQGVPASLFAKPYPPNWGYESKKPHFEFSPASVIHNFLGGFPPLNYQENFSPQFCEIAFPGCKRGSGNFCRSQKPFFWLINK